MSIHRTGFWSSVALVVIGVAYIVTLAIGIATRGLNAPIVDPILAVMETLTLLSAPLMVILMAAIHEYAAAERRIYGVIALSFTIIFAGLTSAVHFVELTALRQLGTAAIVWPSTAYAVESLAWNWILGLALLFAAAVFDAPARPIRRAMLASGVLCVAGTIGPLVGNMHLQLVGVIGYAIGLPISCVMLARLFRS